MNWGQTAAEESPEQRAVRSFSFLSLLPLPALTHSLATHCSFGFTKSASKRPKRTMPLVCLFVCFWLCVCFFWSSLRLCPPSPSSLPPLSSPFSAPSSTVFLIISHSHSLFLHLSFSSRWRRCRGRPCARHAATRCHDSRSREASPRRPWSCLATCFSSCLPTLSTTPKDSFPAHPSGSLFSSK